MGVTNGYFGSVPMIQAAGKVPPEQRELAGESPSPTYSVEKTLKVGVIAYQIYFF